MSHTVLQPGEAPFGLSDDADRGPFGLGEPSDADARPAPTTTGHPFSPVSAPRQATAPAASENERGRARAERRRAQAEARRERRANRPATIGVPRGAAALGAAVTFCAASSSLMLALRPEFQWASQLTVVVPLLVAMAAAGVGQLPAFAGRLLTEWGRPFAAVAFGPFAVLLFASVAAPHLALPWWVPCAAGALAALPFVYSALAPGRLRARPRPVPDDYGRRGAFACAGALALLGYSIATPEAAAFLQVFLAIALAVCAFLGRGLADGVRTWNAPTWWALVAGMVVCWVAVPLDTLAHAFASPLATIVLVLAAAGPLAVLALLQRRAG